MHLPNHALSLPTGLSFEVPDLVMLRGWAEFHELRLAIELDVCVEDDEYEELLGLYDGTCAFRRWMIWRSKEGIVVQPTLGRTMLFDSMPDALEFLIPAGD